MKVMIPAGLQPGQVFQFQAPVAQGGALSPPKAPDAQFTPMDSAVLDAIATATKAAAAGQAQIVAVQAQAQEGGQAQASTQASRGGGTGSTR